MNVKTDRKKANLHNPRTQSLYNARAKIMKALAHPTRLFIVDQLSSGEKCVCELTEMIGADTSTVSRHLSLLKSSGIIADDKRGLNVYYTLKTPCVLNFLGCVEGVMKSNLDEQVNLVG
jgi:DNA-binding transcriptional ArsR family regulator